MTAAGQWASDAVSWTVLLLLFAKLGEIGYHVLCTALELGPIRDLARDSAGPGPGGPPDQDTPSEANIRLVWPVTARLVRNRGRIVRSIVHIVFRYRTLMLGQTAIVACATRPTVARLGAAVLAAGIWWKLRSCSTTGCFL